MKLSVLLLGLLLVVGALASLDGRLLSSLPSLQHPNGGFAGADDEVTLEATKDALFLATLYGTRPQLNLAAIPGFIRTCERAGGYAQTAAATKPDVESTRHALLALTYLNQEINVAQVSKFLAGRVDRSTGFASNAEGEEPTLRTTATVLKNLELLGEGKSALVADITAPLLEFLSEHSQGDHFAFGGVPLLAGNYYGIVIGSVVGFHFGDAAAWAQFISKQQVPSGAFAENGQGSATTLEATTFALSALGALRKTQPGAIANTVSVSALKSFLSRTPDTLHDAARAHRAMALTSGEELLKISVAYEPSNPALPVKESRAVVGAQIKPTLSAKAFSTIDHTGLDVAVSYTLPGEKSAKKQRLIANSSGAYVAEEFIESNKFGSVTFTYSASQYVETVGLIEFEASEQVSFGYGIEVASHAVHTPTGKEVPEREPAPVGTDFTFQVSLFTSTETHKTSGDFEVVFNVLDASGVVIYSSIEDGRSRADEPIEFHWTLETPALPTGFLTFQFNVRGSDHVVHTTASVLYVYSTTMVATEIEFEGGSNEYSLGAAAVIWMTPAVLPDLKTVHALSTTDYAGADISSQRQFVLDAATLSGTSIGNAPGVNHQGRFRFELPFSATLDSLGTTVFSFRFITSSGHAVALSNYDSAAEEVLDDAHAVNATVTAHLQAVDITDQPTAGSLSYGNEVSLRFQLQDATTNSAVSRGEHSNVYLLLNHHDVQHDASFTSSKQAAVIDAEGHYAITWHVDPNAIRGPGYLTVVVENADGAQVPINGVDGKPLRYDVTIDGNIDIDFSATSTENPFYSATAFVSTVKLSSNGRPLEGAKLSVEVTPPSGDVITLPVAGGYPGTYTVSWTAPHTKALSGTYTLKFFREADRVQAAEIDAANEKKYRKERRERQSRGQEVGEEEELPKTPVAALFEKTLTHTQTLYRPWPIRIEFLVFFVFVYAAWTVWPRSSPASN